MSSMADGVLKFPGEEAGEKEVQKEVQKKVRKEKEKAQGSAGENEQRHSHVSRSALVRAMVLTGVFLVLSVLAHSAGQRDELSWYFPVSILLSVLMGAFLYAPLPWKRDGIGQKIYDIAMIAGIPLLSFILVESYNAGFWHVGASLSYLTAEPPYKMIYLNLIFYYIFFMIVSFAAGSFSWGCSISSGILMALAIVNFYVVKFRGSPLVPWDILSIRTAGNVASNYQYTIYWHMLFSTFGFSAVMLGTGKMQMKVRRRWIRFPGLAAAVLAFVLMVQAIQVDSVKEFWNMDTTLFTPNVRYKKNGLVVAYLANLSLINIRKPEGYSVEKVEEIEQQIKDSVKAGQPTASVQPQTEEKTGSADRTAAVRAASADQIASGASALSPDAADSQASLAEDAKGAASETESRESGRTAETKSLESRTASETEGASGTEGASETEAASDYVSPTADGTFDLSKAPNIIVIMNEAFSDLSVIGDFNTSEDYMPFFRREMSQFTSGHLMVSVKGGDTANTEYEFLSGDTMAFLPQGSVVYQQYISESIPTLASYLGSLGYSTEGLHPYLGSGWDRQRVYPLLGFDEFHDIDSFYGAKTIRKFVSDESAFEKIIDEFQNKGDSKKFIFEVTMQNHSGYMANPSTDNGFTQEIALTDVPYETSETIAAERYLTLIRKSDEAYEKLITWFEENVTEPTIIVTFGDHEPSDYVTEVIDNLTGFDANSTDLEETQKHYQVPFFIWNNMGIGKDESLNMISANYLAAYLMEMAGMPMTEYQEFLTQMRQQIPVICANTYITADGEYHDWADMKEDEDNYDVLNQYNILAYNHLIDVKNRVDSLFAQQADDAVTQQLQEQTDLLSEAAG